MSPPPAERPPADGPLVVVRGTDIPYQELAGRRSADPLGAGAPSAMSVRLVELVAGDARTPHLHPLTEEVIYVLEGAGRTWADGTLTPVSAGDLVVVPRGVPHATLADPGGPLRLLCAFPHPDLAANTEELPGPTLR